jgi:hypothetical protein
MWWVMWWHRLALLHLLELCLMGYWQTVGHSALLHKGTPTLDSTLGNCNPVNFILFKPSDWEQGH